MRFRTLVLLGLCGVPAIGAVVPAVADDDWRRHDRDEWRERAWQQGGRREHQWREGYNPPPVTVAPSYGYYSPPAVY
jgi:hypothetical protein